MDLIEAMEEMERRAAPPAAQRRSTAAVAAPPHASDAAAAAAAGTASWDFVLQQAAFVQTRLKALWAAKHRGDPSSSAGSSTSSSVHVPFSWVLSKLMRLIEEYPDGVTEAIVVTELTALLQRRVHSSPSAISSNRKVVRGVEDMTRVLSELEEQDDAISARLVSYDGHKLSIQAEKSSDIKLEMYLHQRFRACSAFLSTQYQYQSSSTEAFPFQRGRTVVFTNAKLMERRDMGSGAQADDSSQSPSYSLLPTQYLALHLDTASNALDRVFAKQSIGLARLDQFVGMQDPAILQQLVVRVKVLDIGAVRPSQTPLHIHRQVIFLGDAASAIEQGPSNNLSTISSTQRLAQASHVMILWDEQVALSRLFQVGDELAISQPYVHVCDAQDTEILRIFSEYSSQQRCAFYLEYGSATVFFVTPQSAAAAASLGNSNTVEASVRDRELQQFIESEQPPLKYENIRHEWLNFSLYSHVKSIRVSHGIPLMAAYFYSYYDPKTNGSFQDSRSGTPVPTLDRAIVSKFYLVVLLQLYNAVSQQTLTVEVTGENALKALRLRPGQTVLLDGLVAVDVRFPAIRKAREHPTLTPQAAEATFAFQSADYTVNRSTSMATAAASSIVALCSDWESIFGKQSMFSENARLTLVNATLGLLKTNLGQVPRLVGSYMRTASTTSRKPEPSAAFVSMGMILAQMCITFVGWLIPEDGNPQIPYSSDASCRKGFSTMCAHKACLRRLELAPTMNSQTSGAAHQNSSSHDSYIPRWKCEFCHEIFSGMEETSQTFCSLVLRLDDGSVTMAQPLFAVCHGETVEALLGLPAQDFSQLSLKDKFAILQQTIGRDYQVLLSRCEKLKVAITPSEQRLQHQFTSPAKQQLSRGGAGAAGSPSSSAASATMVTPVDLRVDLIEPLDAFAASHQLLQTLSRKAQV